MYIKSSEQFKLADDIYLKNFSNQCMNSKQDMHRSKLFAFP